MLIFLLSNTVIFVASGMQTPVAGNVLHARQLVDYTHTYTPCYLIETPPGVILQIFVIEQVTKYLADILQASSM